MPAPIRVDAGISIPGPGLSRAAALWAIGLSKRATAPWQAASQGRLRHVEGNFAELSTERTRLASAFDEAKERHEHELTTQRMRFDALQARASASEKLLGDAREHLLARADEIRIHDRRAGELAMERDALQARIRWANRLMPSKPRGLPKSGPPSRGSRN